MKIEHTGTGDYHIWDNPSQTVTLGFLTLDQWELHDWVWDIDKHHTYICCPWFFYLKFEG